MKEIGNTYGLSVNGASLSTDSPSLGNITLTVNQPGPPSPITPTDSPGFEVFSKSVQAAFGKEVVTAPSSMTGNTDTRHYVSRVCFSNFGTQADPS
jgi:Gly-Xaa carboxypeptidase